MKKAVTATNQVKQNWVGKRIPVSVFDSNNPGLEIKNFINRGADINCKDNFGISVLMYCTDFSCWKSKFAKMLLENAPYDPSTGCITSIDAIDNSGQTALLKTVSSLCQDRHPQELGKEIIRLLIRKNAQVNASDMDGVSPIVRVVYSDRFDLMEIFLETNKHFAGGTDINCKDNFGMSVLMYCTNFMSWKPNFAKMLLENALCDPSTGYITSIDAIDNSGQTALLKTVSSLCQDRHPQELGKKIIKLLIQKNAQVNASDMNGASPITEVVDSDRFDLMEIFLKTNKYFAGGTDINCKDNFGMSVLMYCTSFMGWKPKFAKMLLENALCDSSTGHITSIDAVDNSGQTALLVTVNSLCQDRHSQELGKEIIRLLIRKNAQVNVENINSISPILKAVSEKKYDIIEIFLEEDCFINFYSRDRDCKTVLDYVNRWEKQKPTVFKSLKNRVLKNGGDMLKDWVKDKLKMDIPTDIGSLIIEFLPYSNNNIEFLLDSNN